MCLNHDMYFVPRHDSDHWFQQKKPSVIETRIQVLFKSLFECSQGFFVIRTLDSKKERPTPRKWWAVHHEHSARVESLGFDLAVVDRHVQRGSRRPLREEPEAQGLATADS